MDCCHSALSRRVGGIIFVQRRMDDSGWIPCCDSVDTFVFAPQSSNQYSFQRQISKMDIGQRANLQYKRNWLVLSLGSIWCRQRPANSVEKSRLELIIVADVHDLFCACKPVR